MPDTQDIPIAPLTGALDLRSNPNDMPQGSVRMRMNLQTTGDRLLRRGSGWEKLLSNDNYNNEDFHDQLLTFTSGVPRQPFTLLYQAESTRRVRCLIAATQGKIGQLNQFSGNWRILGSGYGGDQSTSAGAPRFKVAQVGDYVAFTNDYDKPVYIILEEASLTDPPVYVHTFDDLDTIGLSRAAVTWSWHNCLFFADVEMDTQRYPNRILWSDYNNPTSFDPEKSESITGMKELFSNERVLAAGPYGNSFLIYTNKGIWEMTAEGGEESFHFERRYNGDADPKSHILKYPNTLVVLADAHMYMAEDGWYAFSPTYNEPRRLEWIHKAAPWIYDNLDTVNCGAHVATFINNEILISTASAGAPNNCPDRTLRLQMDYRVADVLDKGFTAFCGYEPFSAPTVRDFILTEAICTNSELQQAGYYYFFEGLPRPIPVPRQIDQIPLCIITRHELDNSGLPPDMHPEDYNFNGSDTDSLCRFLTDAGLDKLDAYCIKCEAPALSVACSSDDWCLKQLGNVFFRERCVNTSAVGTTTSDGYYSALGAYVNDGIDSIIRSAPMFSGKKELKIENLRIDFDPAVQAVPSLLFLRVGIAAQPVDPNTGRCDMVWHQHTPRPLACLSKKTAAQHAQANTIPSAYANWQLYRKGRVLCYELQVSGIGGDATFSDIQVEVAALAAQNF